jgi:hypothetical protein
MGSRDISKPNPLKLFRICTPYVAQFILAIQSSKTLKPKNKKYSKDLSYPNKKG